MLDAHVRIAVGNKETVQGIPSEARAAARGVQALDDDVAAEMPRLPGPVNDQSRGEGLIGFENLAREITRA